MIATCNLLIFLFVKDVLIQYRQLRSACTHSLQSLVLLFTVFSFRIVSYNVLAEIYSDTCQSRDFRYSYCPPFALTLDYRKQLVLDEIIGE